MSKGKMILHRTFDIMSQIAQWLTPAELIKARSVSTEYRQVIDRILRGRGVDFTPTCAALFGVPPRILTFAHFRMAVDDQKQIQCLDAEVRELIIGVYFSEDASISTISDTLDLLPKVREVEVEDAYFMLDTSPTLQDNLTSLVGYSSAVDNDFRHLKKLENLEIVPHEGKSIRLPPSLQTLSFFPLNDDYLALGYLRRLKSLQLNFFGESTALTPEITRPLRRLEALEKLSIRGDEYHRSIPCIDLGFVEGLDKLQRVELKACCIRSIEVLKKVPKVFFNTIYDPIDLSFLPDSKVDHIKIEYCSVPNGPDALRHVRRVSVRCVRELINLKFLIVSPNNHSKVQDLSIVGCDRLLAIPSLAGTQVTRLNLADIPALSNLNFLANSRVEYLRIQRCPELDNISGVKWCPLRTLSLEVDSCRIHYEKKMPKDRYVPRNVRNNVRRVFSQGSRPRSGKLSIFGPITNSSIEDLTLIGCYGLTDLGFLVGSKVQRVALHECSNIRSIRGLFKSPVQLAHFTAVYDILGEGDLYDAVTKHGFQIFDEAEHYCSVDCSEYYDFSLLKA